MDGWGADFLRKRLASMAGVRISHEKGLVLRAGAPLGHPENQSRIFIHGFRLQFLRESCHFGHSVWSPLYGHPGGPLAAPGSPEMPQTNPRMLQEAQRGPSSFANKGPLPNLVIVRHTARGLSELLASMNRERQELTSHRAIISLQLRPKALLRCRAV